MAKKKTVFEEPKVDQEVVQVLEQIAVAAETVEPSNVDEVLKRSHDEISSIIKTLEWDMMRKDTVKRLEKLRFELKEIYEKKQ